MKEQNILLLFTQIGFLFHKGGEEQHMFGQEIMTLFIFRSTIMFAVMGYTIDGALAI